MLRIEVWNHENRAGHRVQWLDKQTTSQRLNRISNECYFHFNSPVDDIFINNRNSLISHTYKLDEIDDVVVDSPLWVNKSEKRQKNIDPTINLFLVTYSHEIVISSKNRYNIIVFVVKKSRPFLCNFLFLVDRCQNEKIETMSERKLKFELSFIYLFFSATYFCIITQKCKEYRILSLHCSRIPRSQKKKKLIGRRKNNREI